MKRLLYALVFTVSLFLPGLNQCTRNLFAEIAIVHADRGWQRTDIILKGSNIFTWQVKDDDYWSFNPEIFPEGHSAEGLEVPALHSYALPGENIGILLGRIGGGRILPMGLTGSEYVKPEEGGEYLYLTINDDLIGLYAKGYADNTGEIVVSINQAIMDAVKIDLLFMKGCPGYQQTKKFVEEIIKDKDIIAKINLIQIDNDRDARRLQFIGSPTVRVGGLDIETNRIQTKDYGLRNRLYYVEGQPSAYPSKSMIEGAILKLKTEKQNR